MAKINSVFLESIPKIIHVGDNISDIIINTQIEFHSLDLKLEMEYLLYLFVYDVHGKVDIPVIIGNWDESDVFGVTFDRKDHLLGKKMLNITANKATIQLQTSIALKLGKQKKGASNSSRELEVFATLIPAIGRASKWSEPFETNLVF